MKTAFRSTLVLCLAVSLFVFPADTLADDVAPPDGNQILEGMPVAPADDWQPAVAAPQAVNADTHYLTLTGLDFHPNHSDLTYSSMNGGLYATTNAPPFGYYAAFHLPSGTSVTGITFFLVDNNATENISLGAWTYQPASHVDSHISTRSTIGASADIQSIDLTGGMPFTILNNSYAYRLWVEFFGTGLTQIVYGARISYSLPAVPASTDYVTMAGADFRSSSSNMTFAASTGSLYATAIDPGSYFYNRLDLPQGATITQVYWYLIDNHEESFFLGLYGHNLQYDSLGFPASDNTGGDLPSPNIRTISAEPSLEIDNSTYTYSIGFMPYAASIDLRIIGARVRYTLPDTYAAPVKSFSGVHFLPSSSNLTYRADGASVYALALAGGHGLQVSLNLPSGVHIRHIIFWYIDDSADAFTFTLRFYYPPSGSYSDQRSYTPDNDDSDIQMITWGALSTMAPPNSYDTAPRLRVVLGEASTDMLLIGVTVEYLEPQVYLPIIKN
jgi:hypothetical protein